MSIKRMVMALNQEFKDDPAGLGYTALDDSKRREALLRRDRQRQKRSIQSLELIAAIDNAHLPLDPKATEWLRLLLAHPAVEPSPRIMTQLRSIFAGTASLTRIEAAVLERVSRLDELGESGHISDRSFIEGENTLAFMARCRAGE